MTLLFVLGLMAEALLILLAAKLIRDAVCGLRGTQVNDQIAAGRSAAAVTQAGYLVGVLLGFLGAVRGIARGESFFAAAAGVAVAGLAAIALQLLADLISDKLIFRGVDDRSAEGNNSALAVGKAAVSVATGLVLQGAMSDPGSTLVGRIGWFAAAQLVMVLSVVVYCRLTPYDDLGEIRNNNLAAGFPISGILLAVGFVMETAISGRDGTLTTGQSALRTFEFLGLSLLLVYAFRLIGDFVLLPRLKLAKAIVEQKNVGAGLQEGISFVLASLLVTFFLT